MLLLSSSASSSYEITLSMSLKSCIACSEYLLTSNLPLHIDCSLLRRASSVDSCTLADISRLTSIIITVLVPTTLNDRSPFRKRKKTTVSSSFNSEFSNFLFFNFLFNFQKRHNSVRISTIWLRCHALIYPEYIKFECRNIGAYSGFQLRGAETSGHEV